MGEGGTRTCEPNGPCLKWEKDETQEGPPTLPSPSLRPQKGDECHTGRCLGDSSATSHCSPSLIEANEWQAPVAG